MAQKVPGCLGVPNLHIKIINILIKVICTLIRSSAYQSRLLALFFWVVEKVNDPAAIFVYMWRHFRPQPDG
jgi:hypothetical protein